MILLLKKAKKAVRSKFKCPNCDELGHRKNSPNWQLNGTKKRQVLQYQQLMPFRSLNHQSHSFLCVQKKKAKKEYNQGIVSKRSIYFSASTTRQFSSDSGC
jgi:hypothetical protein